MTISLLVCARAFQFASGLVLVGVVAFRWLILLPAFSSEADETWTHLAPLFRKLQLLFTGSALVVVLSGTILFWAVSADMSGSSLPVALSAETLGTVLFQTQFGAVCQWRIGFALVLGVAVWRLHRGQWLFQRNVSPVEYLAGFAAIALLVSTAWIGHAAATGNFSARLAADAFHLLAASIWPTGLLPFALFLRTVRSTKNIPPLRPVLTAIGRFSHLSFIIVFVLIGTGIINSYFMVGSFTALASTEYGRLLSLKLFLFLVILSIAAINRYRLVPRLLQGDDLTDKDRLGVILNYLQSFVLTEVSLALAIIVVVSLLGITPPAR